MKAHTLTAILFLPLTLQAQDKKVEYVNYDRLIEVEESEYVIATATNTSKAGTSSAYVQFVNTLTGEVKEIDMPKGAHIGNVQHIKMDRLGIDRIVMTGRTVDLDNGKGGITWHDPQQIIVFSVDGKQQVKVTDDNFFAGTWMIDQQTGRMVLTGHRDTNQNEKLDHEDKNEILVFDLKAMSMVRK